MLKAQTYIAICSICGQTDKITLVTNSLSGKSLKHSKVTSNEKDLKRRGIIQHSNVRNLEFCHLDSHTDSAILAANFVTASDV